MSILWTNNASSVLASDITAGTLSITVTTGHGDRFPEVAAPHYFMATLVDTSGNREIVKVTARTSGSNTMTITRAQEGTSARSFATGDIVELRITKNAMDKLSKSANIHENHYVCDASAADQGATTNSSSLKSIVDSLGVTEEATIELPHTGTGDTTTYTVGTNLTIPATVTLIVHKGVRISPSGGVTLTVNGIVQAGSYQIFAGAGTVTVNTYPQDQAWDPDDAVMGIYGEIFVSAGAMIPNDTDGAIAGTYEWPTNDRIMDYLSFSHTAYQAVCFNLIMPSDWNLGTIKVKFYWNPSDNTGTTSDTVEWIIYASAISDNDLYDVAVGTGVASVDNIVSNKSLGLHISPATAALTVTGTPVLGDLIEFKILRGALDVDDTYLAAASLVGVLIQYKKKSASGAAW